MMPAPETSRITGTTEEILGDSREQGRFVRFARRKPVTSHQLCVFSLIRYKWSRKKLQNFVVV